MRRPYEPRRAVQDLGLLADPHDHDLAQGTAWTAGHDRRQRCSVRALKVVPALHIEWVYGRIFGAGCHLSNREEECQRLKLVKRSPGLLCLLPTDNR